MKQSNFKIEEKLKNLEIEKENITSQFEEEIEKLKQEQEFLDNRENALLKLIPESIKNDLEVVKNNENLKKLIDSLFLGQKNLNELSSVLVKRLNEIGVINDDPSSEPLNEKGKAIYYILN